MDKTQSLTPHQAQVILNKGTEPPHLGEYTQTMEHGTYLCRRCGLALFRSSDKFLSSCGWPSFDDELENAIARLPDADGVRTEILCRRCSAHLGHVFHGEYLTAKNTRHCVNSLALDFVSSETVFDSEEGIFAGGCFWGMQYYFNRQLGVLKTEVGYTGGDLTNPSYHDVCRGNSGHYEAIRVIFDTQLTDYETIARLFFEIHDPTQANGQGVDIGQQYQSAAFIYNEHQQEIIKKLCQQLGQKGYAVRTRILPVSPFWKAEESHQDYYDKHQQGPSCHRYTQRFD